uniref:Uncharacterized protein n=1 Tax=Amphimedon queenslandica TaxID=400682 RepID=A0A1X7T9W7_AMPQE
MNSFIFSFSY